MKFLDPTNDIAFKKIFGNNEQKDILKCFLNSVLAKKKDEKIIDVHVEDPYNHPIIEVGKLSIVDVRCTDEKNNNYIVEMQVMDHKDYAQRCQYYSAYSLSRQLGKKGKYKEIKPVIFVGIVCFDMFKSKEYLSHHLILNKDTFEHGLTELEFHFIELSKFNKKQTELKTVIDKWIYFLKEIYDLDKLPSVVEKVPEIKKAADLLEEAMWSNKELIEYEKYWDRYRLIESKIEDSNKESVAIGLAEGLKKGLTEGLEKGLAQGVKKGLTEGLEKKEIELVQEMLKEKLSLKIISKITGLTIKKIKKIV